MRIVWLIARREVRTRVLERTFLVSTAIVVVVIGAAASLPLLLGGADELTVVVTTDSGARVAAAAADQADPDDLRITTERVASIEAARAAVAGAEADVALVPGEDGLVILARQRPDRGLARELQSASAQIRTARALAEADIDAGVVADAMSPPPLAVESLEPVDDSDLDAGLVAFVGSLLLYGQLIGYCVWVASGVVEEKSSRVVEVLLAAVRPRQLLAGKILGIGAVGMLQLLVIAGLGFVVIVGVGDVALPPQTGQVAGAVVLFFVLGYGFYSCAYAVAGALVSRVEDVQNTSAPLTVLILASFFVSFPVAQSPETTFARVLSFVPPAAPLVMPGRIGAGVVGPLELAASIAVMLAATAALVVVAARLYEGSILRTGGRVSIREAWSRQAT